jgi:multicomponent Na+:H+ antiporter subunit D
MMVPLLLAVAIPLGGAVLAALVPARARPVVGMVTAGMASLGALALAAQVWRAGVVVVDVPGPAGLEPVLVADGLAAAMVAMAGVVGLFASAFAIAHHRREPGHPAYWPLWLLLWAAMHALFLAGDLFTIYLMLELVGVCGAALVVLGGDGPTLIAGTRYFFAEFAASATFLLGIALIWREAGSVVLSELPTDLVATSAGGAGLAVMTAGLLLKVPLFPLHFWLPAAHSLAPSTVSPILSAVVVKTSFAVLVRLWFLAVPAAGTHGAVQLLGVLGALAVLWGSLNALRVARVKLLIAYSTVAQLGFMFLLVPMAHAGAWGAWSGGVLQAIAHALAKAAALMAAVVFVEDADGEDVGDLAGTATRRPVATFAFGVAGMSLVGLPPSGGFVAKWYLLEASFQTGQWWWVPVILVGSLLTAAYLMRVVKRTFAPGADGTSVTAVRDPREVIALLLAMAALALGLRPAELLELLHIGAPVAGLGG